MVRIDKLSEKKIDVEVFVFAGRDSVDRGITERCRGGGESDKRRPARAVRVSHT